MAQAELKLPDLVITNPLVRVAFASVDRKEFVPFLDQAVAYENRPITIGPGSAVSQPSLVAKMLDAVDFKGDEKVLEIGTGSGYQAAILSLCSASVDTIEYNPELVAQAKKRLSRLGFANIDIHLRDGVAGLPSRAPFDAIIVSAACREVPAALSNQLAMNGRLILPVGKDPQAERVVLLRRIPSGDKNEVIESLVHFYPLMSPAHGGWTEQLIKEAFARKRNIIKRLKEVNSLAAQACRVKIACDLNLGILPYRLGWNYLPFPDSLYETSQDPINALVEQYPFLQHLLRNYSPGLQL